MEGINIHGPPKNMKFKKLTQLFSILLRESFQVFFCSFLLPNGSVSYRIITQNSTKFGHILIEKGHAQIGVHLSNYPLPLFSALLVS